MSVKRSSLDANIQPVPSSRKAARRSQPPTSQDRSSSGDSTPSEAPALRSSPLAVADTDGTSLSPPHPLGEDVTETTASSSSSSSSSEEESDSSSDENEDTVEDAQAVKETVVTVGAPKKPSLDPERVLSYAQELQARLRAFIPQLRQANTKLATEGNSLSIEDVNEDEQHIELNLGLGVLEQEKQKTKDIEEYIRKTGVDARNRFMTDEGGSVSSESEGDVEDVMANLLGLQKDSSVKTVEEVSVETPSAPSNSGTSTALNAVVPTG